MFSKFSMESDASSILSAPFYRTIYPAYLRPHHDGPTYSDTDVPDQKRRCNPPRLPHGQCLITGESLPCLEGRMLPLSTPTEMLDALECAWQLPFGDLDLSSTERVICLRADLHDFFSRGLLFLIPEPQTIQLLYHEFCVKRTTSCDLRTVLPQSKFQYRLLTCPDIDDCSIIRHSRSTTMGRSTDVMPVASPDSSTPLHQPDFQVFWSPFKELGPLQSSARPESAMFHIWSGLKHLDFDSVTFQILEARLTHITQGGSEGDLRRIMDVVSAWVHCEPEVPDTRTKRPRLPERCVPPSNLRPAHAGLGVEGIFGEPQFGWPIVHPDPDEYASSEESDSEPADDGEEEALLLPPGAASQVLQALNARVQTWVDHASSEHLIVSEDDTEVSSRRSALYAEEPSRIFSELQTDAAGELVPSYSRYYKARPVPPARKQRYRRESLDSRTSSNYW